MPRLLLASGSPRRRDLVRALHLDVRVAPIDVDESVPDGTPPDVTVRDVALRKAIVGRSAHPDALVLAADTTVALDGVWLAKPADRAEAAAMLRRIRGRDHAVFTGLAVATPDATLTDVVHTAVTVAPLSEDDVAAYVASGEGLDKAGAYGIQGEGGRIVSAVDGCYTNVVGLPLCAVAVLLAPAGLRVDAPAPPCGLRTDRRCPHPVWRP